MMPKVLLTGATGYIGGKLLPILVQSGNEVHTLLRSGRKPTTQLDGVTHHTLDGIGAMARVFQQNTFAAVIHLATYYDHAVTHNGVAEMMQSNISLGAELLQMMDSNGCRRLLNITTCAEFGSQGQFAPNSLYAASKRAFRDISHYYTGCRQFHVVDLVFYDNYGPDDPRDKIVNLLFRHLDSPDPLLVSPGEQLLNLVHIDDTVRAIVTGLGVLNAIPLSNKSSRLLYSVAPENPVTLKTLAQEIENTTGRKINIVWGGKPYRENQIMEPWRTEILPNWEARISLREGLKSIA
ncbi:MAG: NAD(P)-dependent oxidoreductase [Pseudomonadota bacterium]